VTLDDETLSRLTVVFSRRPEEGRNHAKLQASATITIAPSGGMRRRLPIACTPNSLQPSSPTSAVWSLQQSIFAAVTTDAALTALFAADPIFSDVPQGSPLPYVTFGQASQRD
jgi:hypothetical protein